ncbi:MAG: hypothetical protein OXG15_03245 [Gammaproteobacteria bacterium]|nr:hypothetical protein [Gammaproteobacteria bacterium]
MTASSVKTHGELFFSPQRSSASREFPHGDFATHLDFCQYANSFKEELTRKVRTVRPGSKLFVSYVIGKAPIPW